MDTGPSNKSSPNTISDNQMDHRLDYEMSSVRENEELRTVMLQILIYRGEINGNLDGNKWESNFASTRGL